LEEYIASKFRGEEGRNQHESSSIIPFNPENGSEIFLRNIG
jgi:hypothetical protein